MPSPRIALVTASAARDLDEDLIPLESALREAGADVTIIAWDDTGNDWSRFDLALMRSTWDYTQRLPEFLAWAERTATRTRLLNPLPAIRWNTDKHYLRDLDKSGVAIVPSAFVEPGDDATAALAAFQLAHPTDEFVVKPAIGAGSRDAQRYHASDRDAAIAHTQRLLEGKRSVLLQPYLDRVDEQGETSLIFFDGHFSHAIRKGPLLKRGEGPTRALFAAEHITPRQPSAAELALAERTLTAIPFGTLLYARVDLLHTDQGSDKDGSPCVLELELTEPSLFFAHAAGSAARCARAIVARAV